MASLLAPAIGGQKEMPEILVPVLIITLIIAALVTFVLTWRGNHPQLFLPVFGALTIAEIAAYFPLVSFPFILPLPMPTAEFVVVVVVLAVLVRSLIFSEFINEPKSESA